MENQKKMSVTALVLMIFASIFGLGNVTTAYYQMGYGAIIWYIAGALLFFIPSSLMFAEYGSALKESQGESTHGLKFQSVKSRPLSAHLFGMLHG